MNRRSFFQKAAAFVAGTLLALKLKSEMFPQNERWNLNQAMTEVDTPFNPIDYMGHYTWETISLKMD